MPVSHCILALVTLDKAGEYVAQHALQIADGRKLVLATFVTFDTGWQFNPRPISEPWDIFHEMVAQASQHLHTMARQLGGEVPIRVAVAQGRATALSMAESEGADLVVVGDHATFHLNDAPFWFHLFTGAQRSVGVFIVPDAATAGVGGWSRRCKNWWCRHVWQGIPAS